MASHLGTLCALHVYGITDGKEVGYVDGTYFVFIFDNGQTICFSGEHKVKYADVIIGGEGFTILVRVSGGQDSRIETPIFLF